MRFMRLEVCNQLIYESSFDPQTGTLVRAVVLSEKPNAYSIADYLPRDGKLRKKVRLEWEKRYPNRNHPFSPVPETIDVSITNWCGFGCPYCYMSSTPDQPHASQDLISQIIDSFDYSPYQIAIGGGEPTGHPQFPKILEDAKSRGVVPNYTTAGHIRRKEVIEATNRYSGGVSLTYHSFKGIDYFKETYKWWRKELATVLNIHLIADRNVAENLKTLRQTFDHPLNIILLAYYPDVGRGTVQGIMPKTVYSVELPEQIRLAIREGHNFSFSEGLLPYFLSRPEIGIPTQHAIRSEGNFSCYINPKGQMSHSSFSPPKEDSPTLYDEILQCQWEDLMPYGMRPFGGACDRCNFSNRCSTPDIHHYLACDFASHNNKEPIVNYDSLYY